MAKLRTVADIQTVQKVTIKIRGSVAISRDASQASTVNRDLVTTTIAAWAEEMGAALRGAHTAPRPVTQPAAPRAGRPHP